MLTATRRKNVKLYLEDVDSGQRLNRINNYTDDRDLIVESVAGVISGSKLIATQISNNDPTRPMERRTKSQDITDTDDFKFLGYLYNPAVFAQSHTGSGVKKYRSSLVTDLSITEANKSTVGAYTSLDTSAQFYDYAKSYLVDNFTGEADTIVTREGETVNAGSYNVTIDATAASVFAFDGSTITIKATAFVGNITTTGVLTLSNGAAHQGLLNGEYFTFDGDIITTNYPVIVATSNATITIDAINYVGEFVVRNGATLTVLGDNNAKTVSSSQTEENGTIVHLRRSCTECKLCY